MPAPIAADVNSLIQDRLRLNTQDNRAGVVPIIYPTTFGNEIIIAGREGGANKFYRVKGKVTPVGKIKPNAPTLAVVASAVGANEDSRFNGVDAGTYFYEVHAMDSKGCISNAVIIETAVIVAAGEKVTLTITPSVDTPCCGFILCRSKKNAVDSKDCREFIRIPTTTENTTTYVDLNEDLPGTGELLLLSLNKIAPAVRWNQFMPATKVDMYPTNALVHPFIIAMFGTVDVQVPWYNGIVKNIDYSGSGFSI